MQGMSAVEHTTPISVRAIALLAAAAFVSAATMRVADPLVPQVANEFGVTAGSAGIVVTAFALAYGTCQLLWGPLGDRFGKFRLVTLMTLVSAVTVALAASADTVLMLGLTRLAAGATAAALIPLSMAFIGDHVAYEQRQATIARFLSGQILGLLSGQIFGGVIGDQYGWRAVFVVLAGLYLVVGILLVLELRGGRLPLPVLSGGGGMRSLGTGIRALLLRPWARVVLLVVMLEGAVFYGAFAYIGAYLHDAFMLSYSEVGLLLIGFGLGGLAFALTVRHLVSALGERGLSLGGGALIAVGFFLIAVAAVPWLITLALVVLGLGFYMLHNTLQVNATQMAPEARGLAVSAFASGFFLGQAAGAWGGGRMVDSVGYTPMFVAAGIAVPALAVLFVVQRARLKP
jgi:predicted MFS family arabinose efflux permease